MGEGEDPALAQPWVILWEIAATRAELLLPHPQRCHTQERDTSPLVSDVLQALCVGNGPQQEGGAGPGRLPAPGNVLTALEAASSFQADLWGQSSAVPGPCTSSTGGALPLIWELLVP